MENQPAAAATVCWSCRRATDPADRFCRHCGKRQAAAGQWFFSPLWIVVLTLTVAGPLTLPLVWKAPRLTRTERWALTAFILLVTAFVACLCYYVAAVFMQSISQLNGALNSQY